MAIIGNSFDLDKALRNQNYAYKCWLNYNQDGNSMRITNDEMTAIKSQWMACLNDWQAKAERDVTEYSIEGSLEWNDAKAEGAEEAKNAAVNDETKWDGNAEKSKNMNTANAVTAGVGGAIGVVGAATSLANMIAVSVGSNKVPLGFMIAAPLEMAVGILYEATHPNRNENKALQALKSLMESGNGTLQSSVAKMESTDIEITNLATESNEDKESTEEKIAKKQELIDAALKVYNEIVARVESGEQISESDKAKLGDCKAQIASLQEEINALQQESVEFSEESADAIESKKSELDEHATTIAEEKGTTEFAASFDEATNKGAKWQVAMHSLNFAAAVMTTVKAIMAACVQPWLAIFAAMSGAGAGMSAHAIVEQSMVISNTNKEIDVRKGTENTIESTTVTYEEKLSNMLAQSDFATETVEDWEDFELEEIELGDTNISTSTQSSEDTPIIASVNVTGDDSENLKQKKEDEKTNPFV